MVTLFRYGGLSELFSQDQEDVKKGEKVKAKAEKEAKAAAKAPPPPDPNVPLITEHQASGNGSTEDLRQAIRRYRSFFNRLLSV